MRFELARLRVELARLRFELARMRFELARMRFELARMRVELARLRFELIEAEVAVECLVVLAVVLAEEEVPVEFRFVFAERQQVAVACRLVLAGGRLVVLTSR
jgi:hypothetical protein